MSMGARRRNGRVGNVDNVNDMNEVVKNMTGLMACLVQLAVYIVKSVGAGGADREVLTAGFIPDGMNYMKMKDVMALALHFERWKQSRKGELGFMVHGCQMMVLVDFKRLAYNGWSENCMS